MKNINVWEMYGFLAYFANQDYKVDINIVDDNYATIVICDVECSTKVVFDYFEEHLTVSISTPRIQLNSIDVDNKSSISLLNEFVPNWYNSERNSQLRKIP